MTDKKDNTPVLAWVSLALTLFAWAALMWINGYVAMAAALVAACAGIIGIRRYSGAVRNIAVTAVIASVVLVVVLTAFLIVIKIGLQG